MSSQGITDNVLGKGIDRLKILLLRKPVSLIDPTQVFEKGRPIYGTTDPDINGVAQVISIKNGDGITQYQNLQELMEDINTLFTPSEGLSWDTSYSPPRLILGGSFYKDATINTETYTLNILGTDGTNQSTLTINPSTSSLLSQVSTDSSMVGTQISGGNVRSFLKNTLPGGDTGILVAKEIPGIGVIDDAFLVGAFYTTDNHVNGIGLKGDRWIPDVGWVNSAISIANIFGPGSLIGTGIISDPYYPNAGNGLTPADPVKGIILGGTLDRHTTINNNGFNFMLNQTSSAVNIANFQFAGDNRFEFDSAGNLHANGIKMLPDQDAGVIDLSGWGIDIYRNKADSADILRISQLNTGGSGNILNLQSSTTTGWVYGGDGSIKHTPMAVSSSTVARGYYLTGGLRPTANGDTLIGLDISPKFGTSTIATLNSGSLVGGSGYPNGIKTTIVTGGTGQQATLSCTISGGAVTSAVLVDGGINYTPGDTLNIVITDSSGTPIGSGATIQVATVTSYTGLINISAKFSNAPVLLNTISTPSTFSSGMVWFDGTHFYGRIGGTSYQLDQQGGGGGGTVNTSNGISGDGSIGTPVILGGTIAGSTTINSLNQYLLIGDPAFNQATIEIDNTAGGSLTLSQGSGPLSTIQLSGDGYLAIQSRNSSGTIYSTIRLDPLGVGITIEDTHNFGLIGAALFTANADPKQYVQWGYLPGAEITFASKPSTPFVGQLVNFSNSTVNTWGATIAGGGSNHVLGRWNGTNWTVVGI